MLHWIHSHPRPAQHVDAHARADFMVGSPHDDAIQSLDPMLAAAGYPENTLCPSCGGVVQQQHWTIDEIREHFLLTSGTAIKLFCPACRRARERQSQSYFGDVGVTALFPGPVPRRTIILAHALRSEGHPCGRRLGGPVMVRRKPTPVDFVQRDIRRIV